MKGKEGHWHVGTWCSQFSASGGLPFPISPFLRKSHINTQSLIDK